MAKRFRSFRGTSSGLTSDPFAPTRVIDTVPVTTLALSPTSIPRNTTIAPAPTPILGPAIQPMTIALPIGPMMSPREIVGISPDPIPIIDPAPARTPAPSPAPAPTPESALELDNASQRGLPLGLDPRTAAETLTLTEIKSLPSPLKEQVVAVAVEQQRLDVVEAASKELTQSQVESLGPAAQAVIDALKRIGTTEATPPPPQDLDAGSAERRGLPVAPRQTGGGMKQVFVGAAIVGIGFAILRSLNR